MNTLSMNKTLSSVSFAVLGLFMILLFVTAKSYIQLGIAIALYPLIAYIAFKVFPRKESQEQLITVSGQQLPMQNITQQTIPVTGKVDVVDVDKRTFLKLIGATGLSFFLFSLLGRRAETLLFGESIESRIANIESGITGSVNTTSTSPLTAEAGNNQGYRISEMNNGIDATFYGFTNDAGAWFIMKEDIETGSFRYIRGSSDFPKNWDRREGLSYDYYHNVFKSAK